MTKEITVPSGPKQGVTQQNLQEKLMLFQLMERQLDAMRQQGALLEQRIVEIDTSLTALEEIARLKDDNEALIPIGSGLFARARITSKKIMTELGARVMKDKSVKEAGSFLEERKKEIEKVEKNVQKEMAEISRSLQRMAPELQRMSDELQKR
jgi:prefoldin alpha subunit